MRSATFADLRQLTEQTRQIRPDVMADLARDASGGVTLRVTGYVADGASQLRLLSGGRDGWLLPPSVTGRHTDPALRKIEDPTLMSADIVVIDRKLGDEWFVDRPLAMTVAPDGDRALLRIAGSVHLDPATAAGGRSLRKGRHQLSVRMDALGLNRLKPLKAGPGAIDRPGVVAVLDHQTRTLLETARSGRLSLNVGVSAAAVRRGIAPVTASCHRRRLTVEFGAGWFATTVIKAELRAERRHSAIVSLSCDSATRRTWSSSVSALDPGEYDIRLLLPRAGALDLASAVVVPYTPKSAARALTRRVRRALAEVRKSLRS